MSVLLQSTSPAGKRAMDFLWVDLMGTAVWIWLSFIAIVLSLLALDLGVLHKHSREIGVRESLLMSGFYLTLGLLFSLFVWYQFGSQPAVEYLTGFVIEK